MKKNILTALVVVVVAAGAYLLYNQFNKPKASSSGISQDDKTKLFNDALGYRGGAAPPQEIIDAANKAAEAAQAKIDALGLRQEFDKFMSGVGLAPVPA